MPLAQTSLTLSRHFSLSFIASGRSSGLHPVSSHSCCMYVRAGCPAFARPYVGCHVLKHYVRAADMRDKGMRTINLHGTNTSFFSAFSKGYQLCENTKKDQSKQCDTDTEDNEIGPKESIYNNYSNKNKLLYWEKFINIQKRKKRKRMLGSYQERQRDTQYQIYILALTHWLQDLKSPQGTFNLGPLIKI